MIDEGFSEQTNNEAAEPSKGTKPGHKSTQKPRGKTDGKATQVTTNNENTIPAPGTDPAADGGAKAPADPKENRGADKKRGKKPSKPTGKQSDAKEADSVTSDNQADPEEVRTALLNVAKPPPNPLLLFFRKDGVPNLILVLTTICLFVAVLLSVVYRVTDPRIRADMARKQNESLGLVFSETLSFTLSPYNERVYEGRDGDGNLKGFSVLVSPVGYAGPIDMIIGVNLGCEVTGISVVNHRETSGYGSKILTEAWFLEQYKGKSEGFEIGDGLDGISGATRSSVAVAEGVKEAVDMILQLVRSDGEGG